MHYKMDEDMTQRVPCWRCKRLLALEFATENGSHIYDETDVDVDYGVLIAICADCLTPHEAWEHALQSANSVLETAEEAIASHEMIADRIASTRDDPRFKAHLADFQAHAETARAQVEFLLANEPEADR